MNSVEVIILLIASALVVYLIYRTRLKNKLKIRNAEKKKYQQTVNEQEELARAVPKDENYRTFGKNYPSQQPFVTAVGVVFLNPVRIDPLKYSLTQKAGKNFIQLNDASHLGEVFMVEFENPNTPASSVKKIKLFNIYDKIHREALFELVYSITKGTKIQFRIIGTENPQNLYTAKDIESAYGIF